MTKKQRNKEYRRAYDIIDGDTNREWCICLLLDRNNYNGCPFPERVYVAYPEFMLFMPENLWHRYSVWFTNNKKGNEERLNCLAFCIAMTE